jgi:ribonuclease HI
MIISVYTDGSCINHGKGKGEGSFGYVISAKRNGKEILKGFSSKKYSGTTSQRMELSAIIEALNMIDPGHTINVYSDSQYCVKGINEWLDGWILTHRLKSRQNNDLWSNFIKVRKKHLTNGSKLNFTWVKGHNGNRLNELADKLAGKGRIKNFDKNEYRFM